MGDRRLTTTGRRTGKQHTVMVGYFEDGANLVTLAMNGWADGEPAWWLNLQAHPDATVDLVTGSRAVRARAAEGQDRSRLWARWRDIDKQLDAYRALYESPGRHLRRRANRAARRLCGAAFGLGSGGP